MRGLDPGIHVFLAFINGSRGWPMNSRLREFIAFVVGKSGIPDLP